MRISRNRWRFDGGASEVDHLQYGALTSVRGDLNCDGHVDFGDINPFVALLTH